VALSLTPTPPANAFVSADQLGMAQETFPLNVFYCNDCTHLQLLDVVDPSLLFSQYVYVSGTSPSFVRHFEQYSDRVAELVGPLDGALTVDIGSNDGTLLRAFKERHGVKVLGIDPARNLAEAATAAGIATIGEFFTPSLADQIVAQYGPAQVVTANNVFAHIDNLAGVLEGIRMLLANTGVFVFEVSYLLDVIEKALFDTIYHEHLAYHAVRPLIPFFRNHDLELIEAIRVPTHGGSLRGVVQHKSGPRPVGTVVHDKCGLRPIGASLAAALAAEKKMGLDHLTTYTDFASRIKAYGDKVSAFLRDLKSRGRRIAGFGAPAKATTLMYHFGIGPDLIDFIVDDNPLKQGTFTPGMHIPVLSAAAIEDHRPDYLLILAWNFAEAIVASNEAFLKNGGRFIVPLPDLKVIET
jgi:SAM-dependent methyltransferase